MAKKSFIDLVREKMDGRTQRWLSNKTKISEPDLSRILRGILIPTDFQVLQINEALQTDFKYN